MHGAESLGGQTCEAALVVGALGVADGERAQPGLQARRAGGHSARVDAAAEKAAERHVADEPQRHGLVEPAHDVAAPGRLVALLRPRGQLPVALDAHLAATCGERVAGRQLVHIADDRVRIGNEVVGEIARQTLRIEGATDVRVSQHRAQLGAEHEPAVRFRVVRRLFAHAVAGEKQQLAAAVPHGEAEHAVEMIETMLAVLLPGVNDHLRIGRGGEAVPGTLEVRTQRAVAVDLAVENDGHRAVLVADRLVAGDEIDHAQARDAERRGALDVIAERVRATVRQRAHHALEHDAVGTNTRRRHEAGDAAHDSELARGRRCVEEPAIGAESLR